MIAYCAIAGGCKSLPAWLGGGSKPPTPHEARPVPNGSRSGARPANEANAGFGTAVNAVSLAFEVYRLDLPHVGDSRQSLKLWNHVDELRADPEKVALRTRSGLRIGVFPRRAWPAIRTILDACGAGVHRERVPAPRGLPLTIEIGLIEEFESIFWYSAGGRLAGKTFKVGKKLILIDYAVYGAMGGRIDLQVSFEVRHDRGVTTWERHGGVLTQVPAYDSHVFSDLAAVLPLNPGESLLIGPGSDAENDFLLGNRFMAYGRGGRRYEKLIIITPTTSPESNVAFR